MFFLGEIFVDLAAAAHARRSTAHCGSCSACIDVCPTQAIVGAVPARCAALHLLPDDRARRADPAGAAAADRQPHLRLRRLPAGLPVEQVRAARDAARLRRARAAGRRRRCCELWAWNEAEFLRHTEGSAIRRIGFARWQRNLAVALGNALRASARRRPSTQALRARLREAPAPLVREHIDWALRRRTAAAALRRGRNARSAARQHRQPERQAEHAEQRRQRHQPGHVRRRCRPCARAST